jgi:hypothetical protein
VTVPESAAETCALSASGDIAMPSSTQSRKELAPRARSAELWNDFEEVMGFWD